MGFSDAVTHAAWFFAIVAIATPAGHATVQTMEDLHEAKDGAREARLALRDTALRVRYVTFDGTTSEMTLTVRNAGVTSLRLDQVDVLLGGVWYAPTSATVDGVATDDWHPGEDAVLVVAGITIPPKEVVVVTENGRRDYARYVPLTIHSASVSTYDGATPTAVFSNGQTVTMQVLVHDAEHEPAADVSVDVRLDLPDGTTETFTASTDAGGVASMDRKLRGHDPAGTYTVTVTGLTKAGYTQDLAASEETTTTFLKV